MGHPACPHPILRLRHATGDISEKAVPDGDSPEATVARGVVSNIPKKFHEYDILTGSSGSFVNPVGPTIPSVFPTIPTLLSTCIRARAANDKPQGDEVLHLPTVVEAAESSPAAAGQAALAIRKFLSVKNHQRAYVQYNSIMLVRILADNPGKTFTRNIDARFVTAVKELLREGRDMSVQQILRETLESFETQKPDDETLAGLREMWKKEKAKQEKRSGMQVSSPTPFLFSFLSLSTFYTRLH